MKKLLFITALLLSISMFGQQAVDSIYIPQYDKTLDEQGFQYVTTSVDGKRYYVKVDKSQKLFDKTIISVDVWVKYNYTSKTKGKNGKLKKIDTGYYLEYMNFDCTGKAYTGGEVLQYNSIGKLINRDERFSNITRRIVPGSVSEGLFEAVCHKIN
ncbi:hypothetical protein DRF60_15085 [Chryseobacterium elymi]|uniref:Surface-adhesin protein E-like domain-containing protein n=1 Tax=Chryseobacterium elymi TaxID=395936 RepID=A0A3D9DCW4_9FLAO|nr:surface-adhesin E family protein [Chryseobacterium elymi]REC75833.1 hypothetical protein DRF60_15085 [Chryseobacterium elymi]